MNELVRQVREAIADRPGDCAGIPTACINAVIIRTLEELAEFTPYPAVIALAQDEWEECSTCEHLCRREDLQPSKVDGEAICVACLEGA